MYLFLILFSYLFSLIYFLIYFKSIHFTTGKHDFSLTIIQSITHFTLMCKTRLCKHWCNADPVVRQNKQEHLSQTERIKSWDVTYDFTLIEVSTVEQNSVLRGLSFRQERFYFLVELLRVQVSSWQTQMKTSTLGHFIFILAHQRKTTDHVQINRH